MDYKPKTIRDTFDGRYIEHKTEKDEKPSIKENLDKIRPHVRDMINDLKKSG